MCYRLNMHSIGIRELKNKLSEILKSTKKNPVIVTNHGKPDSVIISFEKYKALTSKNKTGLDIFAQIDWSDVELEPHPKVIQRDIEL